MHTIVNVCSKFDDTVSDGPIFVGELFCRPPCPAFGKRREVGGVGGGGFFVFAAAGPVLPVLGEDALQELFARFKRRVLVGRLPSHGIGPHDFD